MSDLPAIPKRFRLIDATNWNEHHYVAPSDKCLFVWERMSQVKVGEWDQYPANGLISNLQIPVSCKTDNPARYRHKHPAITYAAKALGQLLGDFRAGTFVPVPPSKTRDHPQYDNRLLRVLKAVTPPLSDIRELVLLTESGDAKQKGRTPYKRGQDYAINTDAEEPEPEIILIFDDVLTTGCHFKAVQNLLSVRFPEAEINGIFLARAVRPPEENWSF